MVPTVDELLKLLQLVAQAGSDGYHPTDRKVLDELNRLYDETPAHEVWFTRQVLADGEAVFGLSACGAAFLNYPTPF